MLKNYHDEKVYRYLLKCFYFKVYRYNELLPLQSELAKQLQVSLQSIKKAIRRLQEEGMVETKKSAGSVCKFDFKNEEHRKKAAMYSSLPSQKTYNTYYFPSNFFGYVTYAGLSDASAIALVSISEAIEKIIHEQGEQRMQNIIDLQMVLIEQIKNDHLKKIAHHFFTKYLYFHVYDEFDMSQKQQLDTISETCFYGVLECIQQKDYTSAAQLMKQAYEQTYEIEHAFSYPYLDEQEPIVKTGDQQAEIIDCLLASCIQNNYGYGDVIAHEIQLAKQFGLSMHSLKIIMKRICDLQLVHKQKAKGIVLALHSENKEGVAYLKNLLRQKQKQYFDALDLIMRSNMYYCRQWAKQGEQANVEAMRTQLQQFEANQQGAIVLITPIVLAPIMQQDAQNEIIKQYHTYVFSFIQNMINVLGTPLQEALMQHRKTMCDLLSLALDALEKNDTQVFIEQIDKAHRCNSALLKSKVKECFTQYLKQFEQDI